MAADEVELEVGSRSVRISNPDRVYFPARGETKLDLVRYYISVGDGIVRALREWTRTVNGKTVTRTLTQAQYDTYASWFANASRLRTLAAELETLSLQEMAKAENWAKITP